MAAQALADKYIEAQYPEMVTAQDMGELERQAAGK